MKAGKEKVFACRGKLLAAGLLVALLAAWDLASGGVSLSAGEVLRALLGRAGEGAEDIVLGIRLPRMLTALLAGASLSLSGAQMQAVFRNPLADPHILGVSGGAAFAAALATMGAGSLLGFGLGIPLALAAFAGAVLSSLLILAVSGRLNSPGALLVFGVMLGFVFSALTSLLAWTAGEESLKMFYSWSAGSFSGTDSIQVALMALSLALSSLLALRGAKGMDILLFGEEFAALGGASPRRIRLLVLLSSCLATGTVTAFCGPLGFVGIVSPHIARRLLGTSVHARVLPMSLLCGAAIALAADIISLSPRTPLPIGSTMALLGIPIVLLILLRR